jgi:hypothetical protein
MFAIRNQRVVVDEGAGPPDWHALTRTRTAAESRMTLIGAAINEKLKRGEDVPAAWSRELRELKKAEGGK